MNRRELSKYVISIATICLGALVVTMMARNPTNHLGISPYQPLKIPFSAWLIETGVPENEVIDCMRWAFGEDYYSTERRMMPDSWNQRHRDVFVMYGHDSLYPSIIKVGKAYLEQKE